MEGQYVGRAVDWGLTTNKSGNPSVGVEFEIQSKDGAKRVKWFGSFKTDKSSAVCIRALVNCGLRGDDVSILATGKEGGGLNTQLDVKLTLIEQAHPESGKVFTKVEWVNSMGGFGKKMELAEAGAVFRGLIANVKEIRVEEGGGNNPESAPEEDVWPDDGKPLPQPNAG